MLHPLTQWLDGPWVCSLEATPFRPEGVVGSRRTRGMPATVYGYGQLLL